MATQDSNTPFAYATMAGFFQRGSDTSMSDECHRFVQNLLDTTCGRHGIVETLSKVKAYTDKAAGNTTDKNDSAESVGSTAAQGPPWMWESQESRMAYKAVDSLSQYILLCSDVHQFIIDPEFEITDRYVLHHQVATLAHVQTARAEGRIPPELDDASVIQLYQAIAGVRCILRHRFSGEVLTRSQPHSAPYHRGRGVRLFEALLFDRAALD